MEASNEGAVIVELQKQIDAWKNYVHNLFLAICYDSEKFPYMLDEMPDNGEKQFILHELFKKSMKNSQIAREYHKLDGLLENCPDYVKAKEDLKDKRVYPEFDNKIKEVYCVK